MSCSIISWSMWLKAKIGNIIFTKIFYPSLIKYSWYVSKKQLTSKYSTISLAKLFLSISSLFPCYPPLLNHPIKPHTTLSTTFLPTTPTLLLIRTSFLSLYSDICLNSFVIILKEITFRLLSKGSRSCWEETERMGHCGLDDGMEREIRISWKIRGISWFRISCLKTQGRYLGFFWSLETKLHISWTWVIRSSRIILLFYT